MKSDSLTTTSLRPDMRLSFSTQSDDSDPGSGLYQFSYDVDSRSTLAMGYGLKPELNFALSPSLESDWNDLAVSQAFNHPLSQFSDQAHSLGYHMMLGDGMAFQVGVWQGEVGDSLNDQQDDMTSTSLSISLTSEVTSRLTGSIDFGGLREDSSFLGTQGSGIWSTEAGSQTWMLGLNFNYALMPTIDALFSYYQLSTDADQPSGLVEYKESLIGNSFSTGLLAEGAGNWQYGFFITQPLRVNQGEATLELPSGYSGYDLTYQQVNLDMAATGRHLEYELALGWHSDELPLSGKVNLVRVNDYANIPGNDDSIILFNLGVEF